MMAGVLFTPALGLLCSALGTNPGFSEPRNSDVQSSELATLGAGRSALKKKRLQQH